MPELKYIRDDNVVYKRLDGPNRFVVYDVFKSISEAKRWTNLREKEEKGSVRRRQSLENDLGPTAVKELLSE